MITVLLLLFGLAILAAGIYYWRKEKADPESRKIYSIISVIGVAIAICDVIKIVVFGI